MTDNTRKNILFTRLTGIGCVIYLIAVDAAAAAAGLTPTLVEGQTKPNNKRKKKQTAINEQNHDICIKYVFLETSASA